MIIEVLKNTPTGAEPTNLQEAQIYFRSEESGGIEDDLIQSFLIQARTAIENARNMSLVNREMELYLDEYAGILPLGPIDPDSWNVVSGTVRKKGFSFPQVTESANARVAFDCVALPNKDIINAVYELAAFWYFRGEINTVDMPEKVKRVIKRYTRRVFV